MFIFSSSIGQNIPKYTKDLWEKNHLVTTGTVLKCAGKGGRETLQKSPLLPFRWEYFPLKTQEVILTSTNQPTTDSKDGGGREDRRNTQTKQDELKEQRK